MDPTAEMKFCADETFVRAWFAFTQLQQLDSGMTCPTCGPYPSVVIVDGISLGTHTSKLVSSIQPPTFVDESSEQLDDQCEHSIPLVYHIATNIRS